MFKDHIHAMRGVLDLIHSQYAHRVPAPQKIGVMLLLSGAVLLLAAEASALAGMAIGLMIAGLFISMSSE